MITSQRLWTYGDSTSTDISIPGGKIDYTELFPALKISKIFEAIENKFSLDFQGLFLTDKRFTNCFLYCKNKELFETWTPNVLLNYTFLYPVQYGLNYLGTITSTDYFNTTTETLSYSFTNNLTYGQRSHVVDFDIQVITASNCTYIVDVYNFGVLEQTFSYVNLNSGDSLSVLVIDELDVVGLNRQLTFKVRANKDSVYRCFVGYYQNSTNYDLLFSIKASSATTTASVGSIDLSSFMPDMTVYDFLSGIFKNFNLTCYAKSKTIFQIEPLEDWYNKGRIIDITKHTTTEEISVSRVPLYKTIKFEHEQSQSFMNREFFDLFGKEYGDLNNTYNYDGADYQIKVPFENLLHSEFDGTMTQVGYCLTKKPDFKPYIPKPILLYMYEQQSTSIKFYNGSTTNTLTTYMPFGQDMKKSTVNYSLNWGSDNSSLLNVPITQGKFATYYYGYLSNLFNKKNRITNVKTILPLSILTTLKLNDRLVIRDKRYIINQMNSKLTNGEVSLELINDFRPVKPISNFRAKKPTSVVDVEVLFPNYVKSATITTTTGGVTISPSTITSEQRIAVTVPTDTNVYYGRITEDGNIRVSETFSNRITEGGDNKVIDLEIEYTFEDGTIETYDNYIIQEQ